MERTVKVHFKEELISMETESVWARLSNNNYACSNNKNLDLLVWNLQHQYIYHYLGHSLVNKVNKPLNSQRRIWPT